MAADTPTWSYNSSRKYDGYGMLTVNSVTVAQSVSQVSTISFPTDIPSLFYLTNIIIKAAASPATVIEYIDGQIIDLIHFAPGGEQLLQIMVPAAFRDEGGTQKFSSRYAVSFEFPWRSTDTLQIRTPPIDSNASPNGSLEYIACVRPIDQ